MSSRSDGVESESSGTQNTIEFNVHPEEEKRIAWLNYLRQQAATRVAPVPPASDTRPADGPKGSGEESTAASKPEPATAPAGPTGAAGMPQFGMRILRRFAPVELRENIEGDLIEEFKSISQERGERAARMWVWGQVLRSVWPLIWKAIKFLITVWKLIS